MVKSPWLALLSVAIVYHGDERANSKIKALDIQACLVPTLTCTNEVSVMIVFYIYWGVQ